MSEDRVRTDVFVGREEELHLFEEIVQPQSEITILNIHTNGEGGIGKTQLLLRMQERCAKISGVHYARGLIDFYHTESHTKFGVLWQIAENLGIHNFFEFEKFSKKYQKTFDISGRENLLPRIEQVFKREYAAFAAKMKEKNRVIALFFDTYEGIQKTDEGYKQVEPTEFSQWLETRLFPHISDNTRLIVSGRYPVTAHSKLSVKVRNLARFTLSDTKVFWKKCFNLQTDHELAEKIGTDELIATFHTLADGRPVMLALFADWLNYTFLSPEQVLREIEEESRKSTKPVKEEQKELFERVLIERIVNALIDPENKAVAYMAVAYRRFTPEMFHFLTETPLKLCHETFWERLKPLSFIKYKEGDIVLLHDEMRRLMVKRWWDEQDGPRVIRKDIAAKIVKYYDEKLLADEDLLETERETYTSELLEYAFFADPKVGLERFCKEFDNALEDRQYITTRDLNYDYCDLLLREAENYHRRNPRDIPFPDFLEITRRRVRYTSVATRNYRQSLRLTTAIIEKYRDHPAWKQSELRGHFWWERGVAESALARFEEAVYSYQQALQTFYEVGKDDWVNWVNNSLGYTYCRQGQFAEAEQYLTQSLDGFYRLLVEEKHLTKRDYRQLFQGLQLAFGNLSVVHGYTGKFENAIRRAEITLDIVRNLPFNALEVARSRATVGRASAFIGHTIDARHHLEQAETILHATENRLIDSRAKTDLSYVQHRVNELAYFLEFYRAEEIEDITQKNEADEEIYKHIGEARTLIENAIIKLSTPPAIKKELADAYYGSGELYMVTPSTDHWQKSEKAFREALKWAKESKFIYREIDTIESLVTLYYFWNGASEVSTEIKEQNREKIRQYREVMEQFDDTVYPDLFGKYEVTLGDIEFDQALESLCDHDTDHLNMTVEFLERAFTYYVSAAHRMKQFHDDFYYLTLRVFYKRLNALADSLQKQNMLPETIQLLDNLQTVWTGKAEEFQTIYNNFSLRFHPQDNLDRIQEVADTLPELLRKGEFGLVSLLNDCLIGAYRSLLFTDPNNEGYRGQLISGLNVQSGFYRILGDEYQTKQCIQEARKELENLADSPLKKELEGYTDLNEGTLQYRRGGYGKLLEYYLQDELALARGRFDRQFGAKARQAALTLLQNGEKKLMDAISASEETLSEISDSREKSRIEEQIRRQRKEMAETKFRIGELLMLSEEFDDHNKQKGALGYLEESIEDAKNSGARYRENNAKQSYVNTLYFAGKYDQPGYRKKRITYEQQLDEHFAASPETIHPSVMARMRIVQGDALFSSSFVRKIESTGEYYYFPIKDRLDIRTLRTMLRYYVEACDFMARHSPANFAMAVRVLQRRIRLIGDKQALQAIQHGLLNIWNNQKYLRGKSEELEVLVQFAKIRSMMLEDENTTYTTE